MSYQATVYKVMIASPSDVKEERQIVREEIANWNAAHSEARGIVLLPVSWEANAAPSSGDRPQGIINKRILAGADLLVGVFWTRLGTSTGKFPSGTVEEIEEHIAQTKPAMLYFSQAPIVPGNLDGDQYAGVQKLRESLKDRALYHVYDDAQAFRPDFAHHLQITMNMPQFAQTAVGIGRIAEETRPSLGDKARSLLVAATEGRDGHILYRDFLGGTIISAGDHDFAEHADARELAAWKAGLGELEDAGLLEANTKRTIFTVTHAGFGMAESLKDK
ncbi:DUF4062 domain-containing protein [Cupriavidus alkaliphilus]|uniref:DUF4062 domain-containing protein n=1 Tax=Cupriavidus alkaliphilus TaxID=942866 RepID=UPI00161A7DC6|nr:DUF4062 domain-containing protein [Cupriavidus alkaliphilus]MBB3014030.1 hypothetical protein [Cupriavidus alkaliphilus]